MGADYSTIHLRLDNVLIIGSGGGLKNKAVAKAKAKDSKDSNELAIEVDIDRLEGYHYHPTGSTFQIYGIITFKGKTGKVSCVKQEIIDYFKKDFPGGSGIGCSHYIYYTGHGQHGTGDWCFYDGTITFEWIYAAFVKYRPRKGSALEIHSDCCFSGNWVDKAERKYNYKSWWNTNCKNEIFVCSAPGSDQVAYDNQYSKKWTKCNGKSWAHLMKGYGAKIFKNKMNQEMQIASITETEHGSYAADSA
eukprot:33743_1